MVAHRVSRSRVSNSHLMSQLVGAVQSKKFLIFLNLIRFCRSSTTMSKAAEIASPEELYDVIVGAASQDPRLVVSSTDRLKKMLDMHGTFDCLSTIACQRSLPLNVRQQSIIQFKNVALNHWKARRYGHSSNSGLKLNFCYQV